MGHIGFVFNCETEREARLLKALLALQDRLHKVSIDKTRSTNDFRMNVGALQSWVNEIVRGRENPPEPDDMYQINVVGPTNG
jgi:hypothetical protein